MATSFSRGLRAISSKETPLNSSCRCKVGKAARFHFESVCLMRLVPAISGFASSADADDAPGWSAMARDCHFTRATGGSSNACMGYCGPPINPDDPDDCPPYGNCNCIGYCGPPIDPDDCPPYGNCNCIG